MSGTTASGSGRTAGVPRLTGGGANRWTVLIVLCVSLLFVALDTTILYVAVPSVTEDLRPGPVELLWIVDVYPLIAASLLILFGTLGDRVGHAAHPPSRLRPLRPGLGRRRARAQPADPHGGPRPARHRRRHDHAGDAVDPAAGLPRPARARGRHRRVERGGRGRRRGRSGARRLPRRELLVGVGLPHQHPDDGRDAADRPMAAAGVARRAQRPLGRDRRDRRGARCAGHRPRRQADRQRRGRGGPDHAPAHRPRHPAAGPLRTPASVGASTR